MCQQRRYYSAEPATKGSPEQHEFQAETRMLLDIVAKSLYSEKEVDNIALTLLQLYNVEETYFLFG